MGHQEETRPAPLAFTTGMPHPLQVWKLCMRKARHAKVCSVPTLVTQPYISCNICRCPPAGRSKEHPTRPTARSAKLLCAPRSRLRVAVPRMFLWLKLSLLASLSHMRLLAPRGVMSARHTFHGLFRHSSAKLGPALPLWPRRSHAECEQCFPSQSHAFMLHPPTLWPLQKLDSVGLVKATCLESFTV